MTSEKLLPQPNGSHVLFAHLEVKSVITQQKIQ